MKFLASCLLAFSTFLVQASVLPDFPFVAVTGQSSKQVAPNSAKLSFRISTFHQSSEVANAQLTQSANKVVALLKSNGITDKQITAFELDKSEKRKRDDNYNELEILGYDLNRRFEVEISDLTKYPALMQQLYATDYVHDLNTSFDTSTRDEVETALIGAAATQAKKKAEQMAEGLSVKIHSVFAFNDSGSFSEIFATFAAGEHTISANMSDAGGESEKQQIFIPQSIEISKTVNVIYKITP